MTDHFKRIYANQAGQYDAMVSREDYQGNILPALETIRSLSGLDVVELGAGTGRVTRLLAPVVKHIRAFDQSAHMLEIAQATLAAAGYTNCELHAAENSALPVPDSSADLVIAGWSLGHATGWFPEGWRDHIRAALLEMARVSKPDGTLIILETMGTGKETPAPPNQVLADYYAMLESEYGFGYKWIRTDYRFESVLEGEQLTRFFFGDELADWIVTEELQILPECTGIWWKHIQKD